MALKSQYYCRRLRVRFAPETLEPKAHGGLVVVIGLNCGRCSSGFCTDYGGSCKPYKQARKDAQYDNKKHILEHLAQRQAKGTKNSSRYIELASDKEMQETLKYEISQRKSAQRSPKGKPITEDKKYNRILAEHW